MRNCKNPECKKDISHKHLNAKFCETKCKDRYHNTTNPERLARAKKFAPKKVVTKTRVVRKSGLLELLERKEMYGYPCDQDGSW